MMLSDLFRLLSPTENYQEDREAGRNLPRWLAMCGFAAPATVPHCARAQPEIDVPPDVVRHVLKFAADEQAVGAIRTLGAGLAAFHVNVPANINVWQHIKGESMLGHAAEALASAAKQIAATAAK